MTSRDRVDTVLRVRRVQELQASGSMARAALASAEAERVLGALHRHYEASRPDDHADGLVPERLRGHEVRTMHARAIQQGRSRVREAEALLAERRAELAVRTMAVKAMERLDDRLAEDERVEAQRAEHREQDERAGAHQLAGIGEPT